MTSVHLGPYAGNQIRPVLRKPVDLLRLDGMKFGNALELLDFIGHHVQVISGHFTGGRHGVVPMQGLATANNALIGFCRSHGGDL